MPPAGEFKPSAVDLGGSFPPLADTMGKSEFEAAATLLVRACQAKGDRWQALTPDDLAAVMKDDVAAKREPLASLIGSPFFRPDPFGLVKAGLVERLGERERATFAFTAAGLVALRRWVRVAAEKSETT